jgi:hypothetical protein
MTDHRAAHHDCSLYGARSNRRKRGETKKVRLWAGVPYWRRTMEVLENNTRIILLPRRHHAPEGFPPLSFLC